MICLVLGIGGIKKVGLFGVLSDHSLFISIGVIVRAFLFYFILFFGRRWRSEGVCVCDSGLLWILDKFVLYPEGS
jgi:hypothetical protein